MRSIKRLLFVLALLALCFAGGCASDKPEKYGVPNIGVLFGKSSSETAQTDTHEAEASAPESAEAGGATAPNRQRAMEILADMTLEEKVGQMIIAKCPEENAAEEAAKYHLGGYLLFARDFEDKSPDSVRADIAEYGESAEIPLLIGVDEEGGEVVRVSKFAPFREEPFGAPMELYAEGGLPLVISDTREKCRLLGALGINMNFAPVCDLPRSQWDYIYGRSFGLDCAVTSECVSAVVSEMNGGGMISVLKHFPGYGNNSDTHTGIAVDTRPMSEFEALDLLPFEAGISAGAPCVMISHNIVVCMDGTLPASLSPEVHRILREELGFEGVIVTDELSMGAIKEYTSGGDAAVSAVRAGNDLLCVSDYASAISEVLSAAERGEITEERIDESVLRILEMKLDYGVVQ